MDQASGLEFDGDDNTDDEGGNFIEDDDGINNFKSYVMPIILTI